MTIKQVTELPKGFATLLEESLAQNFNFLRKMEAEWISGKNRFEKEAECVFAVFDDNKLIGIGGLNRDPYLPQEHIGRVRHLYILQKYRKKGLGKLLMSEIMKKAEVHFQKIRLRTDTQDAALFYESLGFQKVADDSASHEIAF